MATEHLLEEFPPVSTAEWEEVIAQELKGRDYEKSLIWHTAEGLSVKPYYRAEDVKGLDGAPEKFDDRRGERTTGEWQIRVEVSKSSTDAANRAACAAVASGAEGIAFSSVMVRSRGDLERVTANLGEIPLQFERADERLVRLLVDWVNERQNGAMVSTGFDALANVKFAAESIAAAPLSLRPFTVHGEAFEEAGATAVEEIGFALAAGVDFVAAMQEEGVGADRAAASMEFRFAVGANYFFQIAKLRAFRLLWARAMESFGCGPDAARTWIAARTSRWNKTVYDPHVNILRATTEAMAAVLGGADSVTIAPFDECYKAPDEASRRLAQNTQLLLKHEAWLGRVADAGGGSYYLETITDFLAGEGWKRMQEIEARGGYRKAQADGTIAQTLDRGLAAREKAVATRRRILVGTNQFVNVAEQARERVDALRVSETKRGSQAFEELRLRTERFAASGGRLPRIMLAEIGDVRMRAARSGFAAGLFACAGLEAETRRFKKVAEIAAAEADLIVLCSADQEYGAVAEELIPNLKKLGRATPVIVAGNPENSAELRAAGIADFVNVRSNAVEVLSRWQERLGITN